ncbi:MAG: DUF1854 domain-containing protein [Gemmatimonadota bacterium]|jgi:hypothetical protein
MVRMSDAGLRLERRRDGQLWAVRNGEERPVRVRRLFPWSEDARHVSLRDARNREFALVAPGHPLDAASARVLEDAMAAAGFVLEVTAVLGIEEEVEIRVWNVETRQGPRTFQTRLDEWPRETPGGGLVMRDVAGDLYHVPDPAGLDAGSRERLWAFVD